MVNERFKKIYDNCIMHAEDTEAFWMTVLEFLMPMYLKDPGGTGCI